MTENVSHDRWSTWLLQTRSAGDRERKKSIEEGLIPVRDRVLAHAALREGDVLLDVGAGDGLIAFGALPLVGNGGRVIFSDVSQALLDHARMRADEMGVLDRVEFVRAPADRLDGIQDASVDAVTTRSVLIYVADKASAFREFYRVLRPGGRLSIFEPINIFAYPEPPGLYLGIDVWPIELVVAKVRALYQRLQPVATDPMLDFDERDLLSLAEAAGFREAQLQYRATVKPLAPRRWEHLFHSSGNPNIPTLQEAVSEILTPAEAELFIEYFRPRVEEGDGTSREAVAFLWAIK